MCEFSEMNWGGRPWGQGRMALDTVLEVRTSKAEQTFLNRKLLLVTVLLSQYGFSAQEIESWVLWA